MIQIDGVGVSVIKQNQGTAKCGTQNTGGRSLAKKDEEFTCIHKVTVEELQNTTGKCVFIDPGRRNMLYCIREN